MQGTQLEILLATQESLKDVQGVTLVTVVKTWGTSPRPVGSLFSVDQAGKICGSVSGGCLEEDLVEYIQKHPVTKPELLLYGETEEERHRFGLPCGGTIQLVLQPFNDLQIIETLIDKIRRREVVDLITDIASGALSISEGDIERAPNMTSSLWRNVFGPSHRIIIIGAGPISQYLATMALMLNYDIHVCDPRPEYFSQWKLAGTAIHTCYPDDLIEKIGIDKRTAIVTLTHDPKLDDLALLASLNAEMFYLGSLGSRRTTVARKKRMTEHFSFTQQDVDKIQGPAGIDIKSKTPPEIAISILTEITLYKNQALP